MAKRLNDKRADEAAYQALEEAKRLKAPELGDIDFESYKYGGDLDPTLVDAGADVNWENMTPEMAQAAMQGRSEMEGIETDPRLRDAQMDALLSLQDISDRGGRSAEDDANLMRTQNQNAQADRGRRESILQNMAQRGMGGSGMELLAQLDSSQAATDRSAQQGLDIAALAQLRQQDALMNAGQMGGSIRGQDFGEKSQVAQAQDAINRFNTATSTQNNQFNANTANNANQFNTAGNYSAANNNRNTGVDVSRANAGIKNTTDMRNLDARQGNSNAGVDMRNKQQGINKIDLPQQRFQNNSAVSGQLQDAHKTNSGFNHQRGRDMEDDDRKDAHAAFDAFGAMFGGGASAPASSGGNANGASSQSKGGWFTSSDERVKKDVKKVDTIDIDQFLNSINPKKFEYKDKNKHGDGARTGVMVQDLLKSTLGKEAVEQDNDGTLGYDVQKMQGITLAALKRLSDKIDEKE